MSKNLTFPDITEVIYSEEKSLSNLRSKYIEKLRKSGGYTNNLYANKLEESEKAVTAERLKEFEAIYNDYRKHMKRFAKEKNISLQLTKRLKDFIRYNNKIREYLNKGYSLDRILDLIGFRVVIQTPIKDTMKTVHLCYAVLNETIDFFVNEKHALPLVGEPVIDTGFDSTQYPDIIVPKKSLISKEFETNVKDYIISPKRKGYQSLHTVIQLQSGLKFEIQIRTFAMDVVAEIGSASHTGYEEERRYETDILLDYSKIKIPGFGYIAPGLIRDSIGLVKSIDPFSQI